MTAETGRRASRLELLRARLHESGRRCARDGDATARTSTPVRAPLDHDVRRSPLTGRDLSHTTLHGIRPVSRAADLDRRGSRDDTKSDRKFQSVNTNHDRQVPMTRRTEVKGRSKLDASNDRHEYAQVRKPVPSSSLPTDREPTGVEGAEHNDCSTSGPRRMAQKTSSSSSLLAKSQNFFARLRNRKNDPSKTSKSVCRNRGNGNDNESNTRIRRSISESGCAMYASRDLVANNANSVDTSPNLAHVGNEQETVGQLNRPEVVDGDVAADSTNDHVTTSVCIEEEPSASRISTGPDVIQPTESTSGSEQAGCLMSTVVYEECAGSYSLREALLQRGGETVVTETSTSMPSSHIIRRESAASSPQSDDNQVTLRKAQTSSLLPVRGAVSDGCRAMSLAGCRRRKLATAHSAGCMVGGRRDGRLERIQEVDSPPGSADDDEMLLRTQCIASNNSDVTEQRVRSNAIQPSSDARNCKFTA